MSAILVVDDDPAVGESVRFVLERAGYAATGASTVAAAREALMADDTALCILDVWMDGEDGLDFAAEVARSGAPFIVMSGGGPGRSLESVTAKADALGAVAVLYKPFEDEELLNAVRATLGKKSSEL
ncbi:response regulator [Parvularcula dongshanensis]|uniref:DNA-binding response OmpR family regulator n=1 Tax=Parvularcula dongshanensis TaxID=1173995 RepID=A0A840I448_9PROT|nr:response regulator [Parvularcula dongshanensis]MBB4658810.1 DNA-binding response OmpR family regulator [Parvularcula dongshanensis]